MFESSYRYVQLNLAVTALYICNEKFLNNFSKTLKKYFAAINRTTI